MATVIQTVMPVEDLIPGDKFAFGEGTRFSMTIRAVERGDRVSKNSIFLYSNPEGEWCKVFFEEINLVPIVVRAGSVFSIEPRS